MPFSEARDRTFAWAAAGAGTEEPPQQVRDVWNNVEPGFPAPHYPGFEGVQVPVVAARDNTARLLQQSSAIRIDAIRNGVLDVKVANLATGHTLPAGFAFARELWVEVAVSPSASGDDFRVVIGGREGRPLVGGELLDKRQPGLRNFQKVLFNTNTREEVVLQNQATTVLAGQPARDAGFTDRVGPVEPGRILPLTIDLGMDEIGEKVVGAMRAAFVDLRLHIMLEFDDLALLWAGALH